MDPSVPLRNIRLVVSYDGTAYHGWQRQAEGLATVQECIEAAAARVLSHPVTVNGAGRTDAGVHAAGQGANLRTTNLAIPLEALRRSLDSRCPRDIGIVSAAEAPEGFHASISAVGKTYRYRIYTGPATPVDRANRVYHFPRPLDVARMQSAANCLVGTHDFRGLTSSAEAREDTVRTITACRVAIVGDEVHVTVRGGGFLYKMVRNIVGTLVEIGRGRWGPERVDRILETRDRGQAGFTALPGGLCLMHVEYPPSVTAHPGRPGD